MPPLTVPPVSCQEPVVGERARFPISTPVRLTVPPVRDTVPRPDWVSVPARFNVPLVIVVVPVEGARLYTVRVASVRTLIAPALVNVPPRGSMVMNPPARSLWIVPWLIRVRLVPPPYHPL